MLNKRIGMRSALTGMVALIALVAEVGTLLAQPPGRPQGRKHSVNQSRKLDTVPTAQTPKVASRFTVKIDGDDRVIESNGMPDHRTGAFPNQGNPHRMTSQRYSYRVPAKPEMADMITPLGQQSFGIAINGVPFDPGAAEWYKGDPATGWKYEPLSGAIELGLDASHGHLHPSGAYHYHGLPTFLLASLDYDTSVHPPIIGWAADGFPIYPVYGYADPDDPNSEIKALRSSFLLRSGDRPKSVFDPGETYDGTFIGDYVYKKDQGDLDECNGRFCKTPDYPDGTYAYFLTEAWPVIPRNYRGEPSRDFLRRARPVGGGQTRQGQGGGGRKGQRRQGPPR